MTAHTRDTDNLAGLLASQSQRIAALERMVGRGGSGGGGGGVDEVWIGPSDPIVAVPTIELWYDEDEVGVGQPGAVLWQSVQTVQFNSTMNGNQDIAYNDAGGVWGFDTVSTFTMSGMYLLPDRATSVSAYVFSNTYAAPTGGGTIYDIMNANAPGAVWQSLGTINGMQPRPAGHGGMDWTLRLSGVQGGPTNYSFKGLLRMARMVA